MSLSSIRLSAINNLNCMHKRDFTPSIYFLVKGESIVYIGQSTCVSARVQNHLADKEFNSVFFVNVEKQHLDVAEHHFIYLFRPELNGRIKCRDGTLKFNTNIRFHEVEDHFTALVNLGLISDSFCKQVQSKLIDYNFEEYVLTPAKAADAIGITVKQLNEIRLAGKIEFINLNGVKYPSKSIKNHLIQNELRYEFSDTGFYSDISFSSEEDGESMEVFISQLISIDRYKSQIQEERKTY